MTSPRTFRIGERRLLRKAGSVGDVWENIKDYGRDLGETYVNEGIRGKDPVKMATGVVMLPASLLLEGPDRIYAAIVGQRYEAPEGLAGRTTRDTRLLLKDVFTLHPLRALGDGWRLLTSDWILDAGDALGGHRQRTRANIGQTLAA